MDQVLCYKIICPACNHLRFELERPDTPEICELCFSIPKFKGFSKEELRMLDELPSLHGTRKQNLWANRLRLTAISKHHNLNIELLEALLKIVNAHHWIKHLQDIATFDEAQIIQAIEDIKNDTGSPFQ